jgi:hypothetical protein
MSGSRWLVLVLFVLAIPFTLVACDGDDNNEDEDEITEVIERSVTTRDPAVCTELQTQRFTEETTGETGQAAIEDCEEDQAEETLADAVDVNETDIDDGNASAVATFEGGFIDGQSLEVELVDEDGQWKLDHLVGFADFDRAAFVESLLVGISESPDVPQEALGCIRQRLEGVSDEDLQAVFLKDDNRLFDETLAPCFEDQG